jgi:putative oxidoreductase
MFNNTDMGLLILRLGVGLNMMLVHGWGKISGGPSQWRSIGEGMPSLGLGFEPLAWGFASAFAEFGASLLIILGVNFRLATGLLIINMAVAAEHHLNMSSLLPHSGWSGASHALVYLTVYVALFFTGPGRHVLSVKK